MKQRRHAGVLLDWPALNMPLTREREWLKEQKRRQPRAQREYRNKNHKRRTRTRITDITTAEIRALLNSRTYCPLCRKKMTDHGPHKKHIDHIVPIAIGGTHTHGNVRVICATCNLSRPYDGSDLRDHAPTLWATDQCAAEAASALRAVKPETLKRPKTNPWKQDARLLLAQAKKDLALLLRINGLAWEDIATRVGYASAGAAHNAASNCGQRSIFKPGLAS